MPETDHGAAVLAEIARVEEAKRADRVAELERRRLVDGHDPLFGVHRSTLGGGIDPSAMRRDGTLRSEDRDGDRLVAARTIQVRIRGLYQPTVAAWQQAKASLARAENAVAAFERRHVEDARAADGAGVDRLVAAAREELEQALLADRAALRDGDLSKSKRERILLLATVDGAAGVLRDRLAGLPPEPDARLESARAHVLDVRRAVDAALEQVSVVQAIGLRERVPEGRTHGFSQVEYAEVEELLLEDEREAQEAVAAGERAAAVARRATGAAVSALAGESTDEAG